MSAGLAMKFFRDGGSIARRMPVLCARSSFRNAGRSRGPRGSRPRTPCCKPGSANISGERGSLSGGARLRSRARQKISRREKPGGRQKRARKVRCGSLGSQGMHVGSPLKSHKPPRATRRVRGKCQFPEKACGFEIQRRIPGAVLLENMVRSAVSTHGDQKDRRLRIKSLGDGENRPFRQDGDS